MSSVVLRCPNCGTTRPAPGECDACHEAMVRFYCTNHTPGRWLKTVACDACGARFGDAGGAAPSAVAGAPRARARTAGPIRSTEASAGRSSAARPDPSPPPIPVRTGLGSGDRRPIDSGMWPADRTLRPIDVELAPVGRALGCLVRIALLGLLAIVGLFAGLLFLGGSLFGLFGFY